MGSDDSRQRSKKKRDNKISLNFRNDSDNESSDLLENAEIDKTESIINSQMNEQTQTEVQMQLEVVEQKVEPEKVEETPKAEQNTNENAKAAKKKRKQKKKKKNKAANNEAASSENKVDGEQLGSTDKNKQEGQETPGEEFGLEDLDRLSNLKFEVVDDKYVEVMQTTAAIYNDMAYEKDHVKNKYSLMMSRPGAAVPAEITLELLKSTLQAMKKEDEEGDEDEEEQKKKKKKKNKKKKKKPAAEPAVQTGILLK